jgi:hypothetical protein
MRLYQAFSVIYPIYGAAEQPGAPDECAIHPLKHG